MPRLVKGRQLKSHAFSMHETRAFRLRFTLSRTEAGRNFTHSFRLTAYLCIHAHKIMLIPVSILFLPERDYVTFGFLLSQFRLSVCRLSVTLVHPTQGIEPFGNISSPLCTLAIL